MNVAATALRRWSTGAGRLLPALALALLVAMPMAAPGAERPGHRGRDEPPARTEPPARSAPPALGMREPARSRPGVSMDQAIAQVERRYKARVVRADQGESNGRRVYVLRLLSEEGRVSKVQVDAETGEVR